MSTKAKLYIAVTAGIGMLVLAGALLHWQSKDPLRFGCYLLVAILASRLKVRLPGIDGTMSVNFLFVLLGILELSLPETLVIGCSAGLAQVAWRAQTRIEPAKILFNVWGMMANAITIAYLTAWRLAPYFHNNIALLLVVGACTYFVANTMLVTGVISLTENKPFRRIWADCYFWTFPYYLAGAAITGLVGAANRSLGWPTSLLILPTVYWVYRSYRLYLGRLEDEKKRVEVEKQHVEEVASLQLRTIEALALAIEAKDHTTHKHLQRVRTYAIEIARELGLSGGELEALRAASLLHDIGKLAVPEHIINKPGRLTPEEFEKVKIHPVVGSQILERVGFPYPVAPIVRYHHEKWDGSGYPDGLKGTEIPIGARILSAVDFLDALASDRQYRKALPIEEVLTKLGQESGRSFDPKVVEVLRRRYRELEAMAIASSGAQAEQAFDQCLMVERGRAPAAGFELSIPARKKNLEDDFLASIAAARQEAQTLFELSQDLGNSLSLDETLSLLGLRLRKLIPHDSIVTFVTREGRLVAEHCAGDNFRLLSSLQVPLGQGLSGWVAQHSQPIVNGDPAVEAGYLADPKKAVVLRSALAVPLEGVNGVVGVLALYQTEPDAFTTDHLRILQAISTKVALSIENVLRYRQAENSATTDYLTGLPNVRSVFLHLEHELARARREQSPVAVMLCDLNGFKQVNDYYGHLMGDKVLKTFAKMMQEVCREYDYVARMGGDEFVIVAAGITPEAVSEKVLLMDTLARQAGRQLCDKDLLSLSVGTAFYPQDGKDAEQLLAEADRKMYQVKRLHYGQLLPADASTEHVRSATIVN